MAKRNQVTTDLRISADASLKTSRSFINQLDKIIDKFNFGDKIDNQLVKAKNQLKEYNKVLEKVQNKSLMSSEELDNIKKVSKEMTNLIKKTENLYVNLTSSELQKFSKEYIAQIKAQEEAIAKIKNEYTAKTGKNFDKELANYDKLLAKNKELKKQREQLAKNGVEELVTKQIEQTNQKLEQQKKKLQEIEEIKKKSSKVYFDTLNQEASNRGYKNYDDLKSKKVLSEEQIRKNIGSNIYKEEKQELELINKELKSIEAIKDNIELQNKKAVTLANKYNIENVKDLDTLKSQVKIRKDLLNTYKNDKSKLALRNEQLITEEIKKQEQIKKDQNETPLIAKEKELQIIQSGGYVSKASLSASYSATNKSVNNLSNQLTESGIEIITNNATQQIATILQTIDNDIKNSNGELSSIDETNKKLATQSERTADEQDIKDGANIQIAATNADGNKTRSELGKQINSLTKEDAQNVKSIYNSYKSERFSQMSVDSLMADGQLDIESATYQTALRYENMIALLGTKINDIAKVDESQLEKYITGIINDIKAIQQEGDTLLNNALMEIDQKAEELKKFLQEQEHTKGRKSKSTNYKISAAKEFIDNKEINKKYITDAHDLAQGDLEKQRKLVTATLSGKTSSPFQTQIDTHKKFAPIMEEENKNLAKATEQAKFLGSTFDDFKNKVGYFLSLNYVFDQMTRKITEAKQYVKDLDKDMTQIGLVLGKTASQTWKNFDTYAQMADRLSTTTSDVTAAMKLFYQQGLNTVEVNKMVEASAIAAALGESTMEEASKTLTSIMNSYNLAATQAINVTDKISQVAIVSAADFSELSTAIEKVASSAASVGLDLDHLMGYLGKMIETTREAPTNIGTALKTIVANFAQFKEDPNSTTEDGTDVNKVDKALKSVGIQLLDVNGEMRDLGEVIDELGLKWKDLSRNTKSYLATMIAGTRQQSRFYALMNDYDRTLELVDKSSKSSGKATEQFSIYQDSLTASTQRLQNQWEKFYKTTLEGDNFLKSLNNTLTGVLKGVNKIGPAWTAIFGIIGTKSIKDLLNWINRLNEGIKNTRENNLSLEGITNNFAKKGTQTNVAQQQQYSLIPGANWLGQKVAGFGSNQKKLPDTIKDYENLITVQKNLEKQQGILTEQDKILIDDLNNKELATKLNTAATNGDATAAIGNAVATTGEKVAKDAATVSTWGLYAAQVALTMGVALLGLAISAAVTGISAWINKSNNLEKTSKEALKTQQEQVNNLKELNNKYQELNNMVGLSEDEHQELLDTIAALGEEYPNLVEQYNEEGKAIKINNDLLAEQIKLENESLAAKAKTALKSTLNNKDKKLSAYNQAWYSDTKDTNGIYGFIGHTNIDNAIGDNSKAAFEEQQNAIESLVEQGKKFDLKGLKTAANVGDYDMIDVLQTYAARLMSTEDALKQIEERREIAIKAAKKDTDLDALNDYFDDLINFVNTSNKKIETANKNDLRLQMNEVISASVTASNLTNKQKTMANNAINSRVTSLSEKMDDESFAYYADSNEFYDTINNYINDIGKIKDEQTIKAYDDLINSLNQENTSAIDVIQQYQKIKDKLPEGLRDYLLREISSYWSYADDLVNTGLIDKSQKTEIMKISKSSIDKLNNAYRSYIETLGEDEQNQFKEQVKKLYNTDFFTELGQLDTEDLVAVQSFKKKYAQILGNYGKDFLDEVVKKPEYDAEKIQTTLNTAQQGMTTKNKNGVNFTDISQGSTSQEEGLNELTNESENARRNITLVGNELIVTGKEITDSFKDSQEEAINTLQNVIISAEGNIEKYQERLDRLDAKGFENLTEAEKKEAEQLNKNILAEQNRIIKAKELAEAYSKVSIEQDAINKNQNVITGFAAVNKEINSLKDLADMYQYVGNARMSQLDIIQAVAENTDLLTALEVNEQGQLYLTKEGIEAVAAERIGDAKATVDAQIAKLEALKSMIDGDQVYSEYELEMLEEMATQWSNLSDDEKNALVAMAQQLGYNVTSMDQWTTFVQKDLEGARKAWNEYYKASEGKDSNSAITGSSGGGVTTSSSTKEETKTKGEQKKKEIQAEIDRLKAVSTKLGSYQKNPGSLLKDINKLGDYKSGGSDKDKFDPVEDELEKFYNYLRKIEKIEAKLTQMRSKRSLIDQGKNYYIEDLKQENELLTEQQKLYRSYINDESAYLQELRNQLEGAYSQWVSFNNEGVIQVKQTEFVANSEEEQAYLEEFMDLQQKYQDEYNTREDNKNKLLEIENTQLENIKTMYEKILARVTDVNEAIQRQVDLLDHDITMSFSNIAKFDIMDDKMAKAVEGIKNSYSYINDFEKQVSELNKQVKNGPFAELLLWDEALEIWRVNEEKLNDPAIVSKYEKLGYNWQDIDTYVRSVAVKSQSISDSMKETVDSAHEFAETLKGLIDDRISAIQDYYSASTDELNKIFDTFDRKMTDVDNQNNLFGVASASLEDKYLTLVTATAVLKQTIEQLKANKAGILAEIQKEYPEYINMINGMAVVNKQAIEESTNLTDKQKAELLQLYGVLEASEDQIKDLEDKLVDYFNTMLEMEEAKRDAIIELKQSVHDELIARDQEEIDNLRSKYDKMSQLDQEYYSELSQRVNDSRNLRENRQQASDIAQMQARLAILKADNSGTYNAELIDLQRQISDQLQAQADNDIDRELERIQREQQQREEDRQLTISAMENVLTFKDENNWYWQEAQRIWDEGPESVTGFLRSSNEYSNISMEQRALQFEQLTNSMNTAFTTLQTAQGITSAISDGIVSDRSYEEQAKLDGVNSNLSFIQSQINGGEGSLANRIDWSNAKNMEKLDQVILGATNNTGTITTKMQTLYTQNIGPGIKNVKDAITSYLGANSAIWLKINDTKTSLDNTKGDMNTGFDKTVTAAANAATTITNKITEATKEYIDSDTRLYNWLNDKYAKKNAPVTPSNGNGNTAATKPPTKNGSGNSSASNGGNGSGSNTANTRPNLKVGARISVKPGTRWYYDSYGTSPSGTARGGIIRYTNLKGSHPYNIEGLGWIRRQDIVGYSKGGYVDYTGVANVHGTQTEPEAFLNAKQTRLFEGLRDSLVRGANKTYSKEDKEITKEEYNIDNISIEVKQIADVDAIDKVTKRVKEEIYKDAMSNKNNMAVRRR